MLLKELQELQASIEQLDLCLSSVYTILDEILSHPAKNYDLTFKKRRFELYHPFDNDNKLQIEKKRRTYLKLLLGHVLDKRIKKMPREYNEKYYELLFAFCNGEDPKDHQISMSTMSEVYKVRDKEDELYGKKRPLDKETYQVKQQMDTSVGEEK